MKILIVADGYLPGYKYGGPVRSLAAMVEQLGNEFEFSVITAGSEMGEAEPYPDIETDTWTQVGNAEVWYSRHRRVSPWFWRQILADRNPGIVYLNSFFSPVSIAYLLWHRLGMVSRVPILLAPRGEFSAGALSQKPIKKKCFLWASSLLNLHRDLVFEASPGPEKDEITSALGNDAVCVVAPNLVEPLPSEDYVRLKTPRSATFVWLSRISPKKNLKGAISILCNASGLANLYIYGPKEDQRYWQACEALAESLPANVKFTYGGERRHELVPSTLAEHQFFFFPTLGENFGHVIAEALSQGLPVIVSDQTPWRGLEAAGVGWDIPLEDTEQWTQVVDRCIAMGDDEYQVMSTRCRGYVELWMEENGGRQAIIDMFRYVACDEQNG